MSDIEKLYKERVNRFVTTANLQEPDKVPVLGLFETWALGYSKTKYEDILDDFDKEMYAYNKVITDFPFDGVIATGNHRASKLYRALGRDAYFVSDDGYTLQHQETAIMENPEDYPKFIANPLEFTFNELLVKKFPNLQKNNEENKLALKIAMGAGQEFVKKMHDGEQIAREKFGMPNINGNYCVAPVDILFDFYRGFKGITIDVRRRPEMVLEAADKIADLLIPFLASNQHCKGGYPFLFIPIHLPGFLSPKQFEKIYWPSFKKVFFPLMEQGFKFEFYMETAAEHIFDYMNELPKGKAIIMLEKDDMVNAKKKIGNNVTISGGMKTELLKFGTKKECIDETKRIIDACAPGGGFILSTDQILIAPEDVNPENFKAALECAHEYGIY